VPLSATLPAIIIRPPRVTTSKRQKSHPCGPSQIDAQGGEQLPVTRRRAAGLLVDLDADRGDDVVDLGQALEQEVGPGHAAAGVGGKPVGPGCFKECGSAQTTSLDEEAAIQGSHY
jgi:hypothetical protein